LRAKKKNRSFLWFFLLANMLSVLQRGGGGGGGKGTRFSNLFILEPSGEGHYVVSSQKVHAAPEVWQIGQGLPSPHHLRGKEINGRTPYNPF